MKETGEWGQFFPIAMSPFSYNESMAQDYFPLTKEETSQRGYRWRDHLGNPIEVKKQAKGNAALALPDSIEETGVDVLDQPLICALSEQPFRVIRPELELYRKLRVPVPQASPLERHKRRWALRNPRHLWVRPCAECGTELQTSYNPDKPDKVLCETCYHEIVV